jgi:hypothetical protein
MPSSEEEITAQDHQDENPAGEQEAMAVAADHRASDSEGEGRDPDAQEAPLEAPADGEALVGIG